MIPAWVDRREYPFEPRTLDVDGGRLSYVDEGHAPPEERAPETLERLAPFLERSGGEG